MHFSSFCDHNETRVFRDSGREMGTLMQVIHEDMATKIYLLKVVVTRYENKGGHFETASFPHMHRKGTDMRNSPCIWRDDISLSYAVFTSGSYSLTVTPMMKNVPFTASFRFHDDTF